MTEPFSKGSISQEKAAVQARSLLYIHLGPRDQARKNKALKYSLRHI